jgi:hypothetical protein
VRRIDHGDAHAVYLEGNRVQQRARVPRVTKPEDDAFVWHYVNAQIAEPPSADGCSRLGVFAEAAASQAIAKPGVLDERSYVNDEIDVVGRAKGGGGRVRDEERPDRASDEDDSVE